MNPIEVVKQRLQQYNSPYRSASHCIKDTFQKEGAFRHHSEKRKCARLFGGCWWASGGCWHVAAVTPTLPAAAPSAQLLDVRTHSCGFLSKCDAGRAGRSTLPQHSPSPIGQCVRAATPPDLPLPAVLNENCIYYRMVRSHRSALSLESSDVNVGPFEGGLTSRAILADLQ
jgi:hypothetical protein